MRRLYLEPAELAACEGGEVRLTGPRARRLREVLRLRAGGALAVFDGLGHEHEASVVSMQATSVVLAIGSVLASLPEPPVSVVLACAFPRAARGDWLVEKATEVGVARLIPLDTDRSVMRPGDGRLARWQRIAIEAAEQCGRALVPAIGGEVPADATVIVGDPDAALTIRACLASLVAPPSSVALYIGPEGGWTADELAVLDARGALRCSLGPRLMRVETAAIVAAAQVIEATGGLAPVSGVRAQTWL